MPDITLYLPVSDNILSRYKSLNDDQRDLLTFSLAEQLRQLLADLTNNPPLPKDGSRPPGHTSKAIVLSTVPAATRELIQEIAKSMDVTHTHVVRLAICDFLKLPANHPDRSPRKEGRSWHHTDTDNYIPLAYRVLMRDGLTIKTYMSGRRTKTKFVQYLTDWCIKRTQTPATSTTSTGE